MFTRFRLRSDLHDVSVQASIAAGNLRDDIRTIYQLQLLKAERALLRRVRGESKRVGVSEFRAIRARNGFRSVRDTLPIQGTDLKDRSTVPAPAPAPGPGALRDECLGTPLDADSPCNPDAGPCSCGWGCTAEHPVCSYPDC